MPVKRNIIHINPNTIARNRRIIPNDNTVRNYLKITKNKPVQTYNRKKKRVFIIGGGHSLLGFDFNKLKNEDTIVINQAIKYVEHATYFLTMDYTFLAKSNIDIEYINSKSTYSYFIINAVHEYIKKINGEYIDTRFGLKYTHLNKFSNIIESNTIVNKATGFSEDINQFANGNNSGFCALQLGLLLEYEEIYLLGFDLCIDINGKDTHFHNSYRQPVGKFNERLLEYSKLFKDAIDLTKYKHKIFSCSAVSYLNTLIKYIDFNSIDLTTNIQMELSDLMIVGYYTIDTPYQEEAKKLIQSCNNLNLNYDIIGVPNLGSWQSNTRFKAQFMLDMLDKHKDKRLLYVDCDAIINSQPILFNNYSCDIAVRYQDFSWRKNECLSGTIYMENNDKTRKVCRLWLERNESEGKDAKTFEQWNLGAIIEEMKISDNLIVNNLSPEYCYIFDSMKKIYPNVRPIVEHFQKSRLYKKLI